MRYEWSTFGKSLILINSIDLLVQLEIFHELRVSSIYMEIIELPSRILRMHAMEYRLV